MSAKYRLPRGTRDFLPRDAYTVTVLENQARSIFHLYGYKEARFPLIENIEVFIRGLGQNTEIVEKQIFKIEGRDNLCLRPEATAQIVRSYIENHLFREKTVRLFYMGAMFRGERPQKGRLRQFHHIGAEALGVKSPYLDAEVIALARDLLLAMGIAECTLEINTLGCKDDKNKLKVLLKDKLKDKLTHFCENCKHRFNTNILRILDCKKPGCRKIVSSLKIAGQYLCQNCGFYFERVCQNLEELNVKYQLNPTLVRGLDYYTQTIFEFISTRLGTQNAVGAGGRYDDLIEELGGPKNPACGFALGLERALLLREKVAPPALDAFVVYTHKDLSQRAFLLLRDLRAAGISSSMDFEGGSLKSQLRFAQKINVKFAVIVGEDELKENSFTLRDMQASDQEVIAISNLVTVLKNKLSTSSS